MSGRIAATRSNLLRATRRLARVSKGVALLRRKREALVTELFKVAHPAADARARVEAESRRAYPALLAAFAAHGRAGLAALAWPTRDLALDISAESVWGIPVSVIADLPVVARTAAARGVPPGSAGPAAASAARRFETLTQLLLEAAPREMLLRRLGDALAQTSRQVHTLERRLAPGLELQIATLRRTLDERERDAHLRLKRLRDLRTRTNSLGI